MNVNEIRDKYCVDKRQTGQNAVTRKYDDKGRLVGNVAFNINKAPGGDDPAIKGDIRRHMRLGQKKDPLLTPLKERTGDIQKLKKIKDFKSRVLSELKQMVNYAEKMNDPRSIKDNIERIIPRLKSFMESEVK